MNANTNHLSKEKAKEVDKLESWSLKKIAITVLISKINVT